MIRDRFYRQILDGLAGQLDPDAFEQCASDVLRDVFPGLAPVRGGGDAGMDGAIPSATGTAFPLICTIGSDAIGNLTKNLKSNRNAGGTSTRAVFATSQQLTPKRRRNLEKRAAELGFTLVQVFDRAAIADRLYRDSRWCNELLNLTGSPPALSVIPLTRRRLDELQLVARAADLNWLRESRGDRLLVGLPGSGKTAALYTLTRDGWGLFVVEAERSRIADSVRDQDPAVIIIDDAHVQLETLGLLQQLRSEMMASFEIVATCWPGEDERVADILNIPSDKVRKLSLLTRDEIVEVIQGVGLSGPAPLIREIVTQANGRPGLAVTLTDLCLRGGVREVALGDAITRNVRSVFEPRIGDEGLRLLAAFALGGESGMDDMVVGQLLHVPIPELSSRIAALSYGGIVTAAPNRSNNGSRIIVQPAALRAALVRDVFFKGPGRIPVQPLAVHAPSQKDLAITLVGAQACGAGIESDFLRSFLEQANSRSAWREYASLGPTEATWVLQHHPEFTSEIAESALNRAPAIAIPQLLELAQSDERPTPQNPSHPFRKIEDWILTAHPTQPLEINPVERRKILLSTAARWIRAGGDARIGIRAMMLALSPNFNTHSLDPGAGMTVTISSGLLLDADLITLGEMWHVVRDEISKLPKVPWVEIFSGIENWAYPQRWLGDLPSNDTGKFMKDLASTMLRDAISLSGDHRGALHCVGSISSRSGLAMDVQQDETFEILFGDPEDRDPDEWERVDRQARESVGRLAEHWCRQDPAFVASELASLEKDALEIGHSYPRRVADLAKRILSLVEFQTPWINAAIDSRLNPDAILPFLERAVHDKEEGWEIALGRVLSIPEERAAGVYAILTATDPPERLLDIALAWLPEHTQLIKSLCARGSIPEPTLARLLKHQSALVAGEAAYGEWFSDPEGIVRSSLVGDWRDAILRHTDKYDIAHVLEEDPILAHDWLKRRISAGEHLWFVHSGDPVAVALDTLNTQHRRSILVALRDVGTADLMLVARLIGDDAVLYAELLAIDELISVRSAPLMGSFSPAWVEKAQLALRHGIPAEEIAGVLLVESGAVFGNRSSKLAATIADIEQFSKDQDEDVRRILTFAIETTKARHANALRDELHEAIHGMR